MNLFSLFSAIYRDLFFSLVSVFLLLPRVTCAGNFFQEADARTLTATVSQTMGGVLFVLIPADAGLTARKDDGVGNKVPFDEDIGATGTGANGIDLTLNGTAYKAYGEFSLIDADTIIYIGG